MQGIPTTVNDTTNVRFNSQMSCIVDINGIIGALADLDIKDLQQFDMLHASLLRALQIKINGLNFLRNGLVVRIHPDKESIIQKYVRSRFGVYKKSLTGYLTVHYSNFDDLFKKCYGAPILCPGSCSSVGTDYFTSPCTTFARVNWSDENPLGNFIFDHWYEQRNIRLSISHALWFLAECIIDICRKGYDSDDLEAVWGKHASTVVYLMGYDSGEMYPLPVRRAPIVMRIKGIYNSIATSKLKAWLVKRPVVREVSYEDCLSSNITQMSERIFNLLHDGVIIDMDKYMTDLFGVGSNIILRCAHCDAKGKNDHPPYDKHRYLVEVSCRDDLSD